jgi:hypothetical protein
VKPVEHLGTRKGDKCKATLMPLKQIIKTKLSEISIEA